MVPSAESDTSPLLFVARRANRTYLVGVKGVDNQRQQLTDIGRKGICKFDVFARSSRNAGSFRYIQVVASAADMVKEN
jgi:hypothetical protein